MASRHQRLAIPLTLCIDLMNLANQKHRIDIKRKRNVAQDRYRSNLCTKRQSFNPTSFPSLLSLANQIQHSEVTR